MVLRMSTSLGSGQLFHWSATDLAVGTILEPRFFKDSHFLIIVRDALAMGPDALRLLMLADDLMFERFPRWKAAGMARVDKVAHEVIFELVRAQRFPHRPPRIGGAFLFSTLEFAQRFRSQIRGNRGVILTCIVDEGDPFTADMNLVKNLEPHRPIRSEIETAEKNAERYWSGVVAEDAWPEVIVGGGRVRVLERSE